MNSDQVMSLLRTVLTIAGTFAASKGWLSSSDLSALTADLLAAVGPVMILGSAIWSAYAHTQDAKIASVNSIPSVKVVSATATAATVTTAPTTN